MRQSTLLEEVGAELKGRRLARHGSSPPRPGVVLQHYHLLPVFFMIANGQVEGGGRYWRRWCGFKARRCGARDISSPLRLASQAQFLADNVLSGISLASILGVRDDEDARRRESAKTSAFEHDAHPDFDFGPRPKLWFQIRKEKKKSASLRRRMHF